jgi:galactokinase
VKNTFIKIFGPGAKPILISSPGRINLIGEHTDYNDGFVLPAAIDRYISFAIAKNNGKTCRIYSVDFGQQFEFSANEIKKSPLQWANYLIGVVEQFMKAGNELSGFDCVLGGDIPMGAGLSSSAAIEAGLAFGLNEIFELGIDRKTLAKMAQKSENEFVGVRCGIMDQFANLLSKEKSVFKLDCRSLDHTYYPFNENSLEFILCDTRVKHELASSEYNLRREQCEKGVKKISAHDHSVKSLRDVNFEMLERYKKELDPVVYKRCHYVLEENNRVEAACHALERSDYLYFGKLLYESHKGLTNEYEVSCAELDKLVDIAAKTQGVLGARMMGGGFGGCTLNLVKKNAANEFKTIVSEEYSRQFGKAPKFYECNLVEGTKIVDG